jgi:hypothetical protein
MTKDEALKRAQEFIDSVKVHPTQIAARDAIHTAIKQALIAPVQEPVAWTAREIELIDGMIQIQMDHAERCDHIANRSMAEKQKGWDMERVALLQKIRATPPAAQRQWVGLTPHERMMCRSYDIDEAIANTETKLKEKNT